MSNWTAITANDIRTGKNTALLDAVQGLADSRSEADPLPEMIADVVATLRGAISTGNRLDSDTTKIPNSLKGIAIRMVVRRLKDYLDVEMTPAEQKQADDDRSYLNRIVDAKIQFEQPDTSGGDAEMQSTKGFEQVTGQTTERTDFTREGMSGL